MFGTESLPPREAPLHRRFIRIAAVAALILSAVYLTWRVLFTIEMSAWFVALPLLILELHHAFGLGLFTFSLWDIDPLPGWKEVTKTDLRLAILIPTHDEPLEVLLPVIGAACAVEPAHETWVLDDGNRPEVEELALGFGAKYLAREENTGYKAGNINNALEHLEDVDLVGVVDADHVVLPNFFRHTLHYFEDEAVAVVQTPQDFYNVDSFEHETHKGNEHGFSEQAVFYRVILPAKNRWDAVFWCGTGAVVRLDALRDVGGVATETITEDIHTSIRMQKRGWRVVGHNEVLARGLAAATAEQYMLQRKRWARGAMQVLRTEKFLTSSQLTVPQRLAYAATLVAWFDSLRSLLYAVLPIVVLTTGVLPIDAPFSVFGPAFAVTFLAQHFALRLLARGYYPPWLSLVFETLRMPAVVPALGEFLRRTDARFSITRKGRVESDRRILAHPMLASLLVGSTAAFVWFVATALGLTPVTYAVPAAMIGTALFLVANLVLLVAAARRVMSPRHAGERRASVRFPVRIAGAVDNAPGRVDDISLTGARVKVFGPLDQPPWVDVSPREFAVGDEVEVVLPRLAISLRATVVRVKRDRFIGCEVGVDFQRGQWGKVRDLALVLFHGDRSLAHAAEDEADVTAAS